MQKWEYLTVEYLGGRDKPSLIRVSPQGTMDFSWMESEFEVELRNQWDKDMIFIQNKAVRQPSSTALLAYIGENGWEAVDLGRDEATFKRPIED